MGTFGGLQSVTPMALPAVNGGARTWLHSSNASRKHALEAPIGFRYPISTRSRGFLPRGLSEARLEGTPTQSLNMKSAGSVRSRPQCHCRDPRDCRGHHGGFCSTRTRRGVSTSPCGVGTSPTAASGATPGRQWSSATSSGGAQRLFILRTYPYPAYGTAAPVGGGPGGRRDGREHPNPRAQSTGLWG